MLTGMLGVKSNTPEQLLKAMNMLGMGTTITGDIKTEGDIRIDGKVIGKVSINSKLAVGESGIIEGDVQCIDGDIYAAKLVVEEGAKINGKCSMGGAPATPAAHQQNTESSARLKSETNK